MQAHAYMNYGEDSESNYDEETTGNTVEEVDELLESGAEPAEEEVNESSSSYNWATALGVVGVGTLLSLSSACKSAGVSVRIGGGRRDSGYHHRHQKPKHYFGNMVQDREDADERRERYPRR